MTQKTSISKQNCYRPHVPSAIRIHKSPADPTATFAPGERYVYRTGIRSMRAQIPGNYPTDPGSMSLERVEGRTRYLERNVYAQQ